ncbi:hypothetical protein DY000_02022490 [Brassica cretica]|uniref:Uncharacterized protein n=1 Tax=Brassica cretica TaxID=69181 RepID=A0ABQ7EKD9_BRACR|nr:hypothetical protein DY000_02022490 [Brassica cretica]
MSPAKIRSMNQTFNIPLNTIYYNTDAAWRQDNLSTGIRWIFSLNESSALTHAIHPG